MAVPIQSPVPAGHAVPAVWVARTAIVLFIATLAAATFPAPPIGPPSAGFAVWAAIVVAGFALSAAVATASQDRGKRLVRTPLGYAALAALAAAAVMLAAALTAGANHDLFLFFAGPLALIAASALGTLAVFRASGAHMRFLPATASGWWAAAFLVAFLAVEYSPWAVLTDATVMAGPALALAAIVSDRDRSVLSALALVAAPAQLAFVELAVLISSFTPHP